MIKHIEHIPITVLRRTIRDIKDKCKYHSRQLRINCDQLVILREQLLQLRLDSQKHSKARRALKKKIEEKNGRL